MCVCVHVNIIYVYIHSYAKGKRKWRVWRCIDYIGTQSETDDDDDFVDTKRGGRKCAAHRVIVDRATVRFSGSSRLDHGFAAARYRHVLLYILYYILYTKLELSVLAMDYSARTLFLHCSDWNWLYIIYRASSASCRYIQLLSLYPCDFMWVRPSGCFSLFPFVCFVTTHFFFFYFKTLVASTCFWFFFSWSSC